MDIYIKKSIRNGLWGLLIISVFSFTFGGLYTEMYLENLDFSLENILWALGGAILNGISFFVPVFVISLIWYYFKNKSKRK